MPEPVLRAVITVNSKTKTFSALVMVCPLSRLGLKLVNTSGKQYNKFMIIIIIFNTRIKYQILKN